MDIIKSLVNGIFPFIFISDEIDRFYLVYFRRVVTSCAFLFGALVLVALTFEAQIPVRIFLAATMFLWVPVSYSMEPAAQVAQARYQKIQNFRKIIKFHTGVAAILVMCWMMSTMPNIDQSLIDRMPIAIVTLYLASLWNQTMITALFHYHLFERGSFIVILIGIGIGLIWFLLDR